MRNSNKYQREYYNTHPEAREWNREYQKVYRRTAKSKKYMRKYRKALTILKNKYRDEFDEIVENMN